MTSIEEYRKKIRNCGLRKKLNKIAKAESYYRFLIQTSDKETANRWLAMRYPKRGRLEK